jgi:hypothetical protein
MLIQEDSLALARQCTSDFYIEVLLGKVFNLSYQSLLTLDSITGDDGDLRANYTNSIIISRDQTV